MLFLEKKSALVRLSDCIKLGIGNCLDTTQELIGLHKRYENPRKKIRKTAKDILDGKISQEEGERKIEDENKNIPQEDAMRAISLKARLHSECLSLILNTCFALESYINSLGYHLHQVVDKKMSTLGKWEKLGKLQEGKGFDTSKNPFQDLKILFRFRNDMVHDKVVDYSDEREKRKYNNKLPDPVFGFLDLRHVIYAADTYWSMITEIHRLIGIKMSEFHRHYNLKPWFDVNFEKKVREASNLYIDLT
jgi:hypothetical protein